jgi:hypothetical protein
MMSSYHDAILCPDCIEFWGNRRFVIQAAAPLQIAVKGRARFVITEGLGFDRGQKVTKAELRRKFWTLRQVARS